MDLTQKMTLKEKCYILPGKNFWQTRSVEQLGAEVASQGCNLEYFSEDHIPNGLWRVPV